MTVRSPDDLDRAVVQSRRAGCNLPDGLYLTYNVWHESDLWQRQCRHDRINDGRRSIGVRLRLRPDHDTPHELGEFQIVEYKFADGTHALHLAMFSDAWPLLNYLAPFFDALARGEVRTIGDVRALLDRLGGIDCTDRPE